MVKRSESSLSAGSVIPTMPISKCVKYQQTNRLQSAPYLFWMTSHHASERDIFDNGQVIFDNREAAHAAQHFLIKDALQQL